MEANTAPLLLTALERGGLQFPSAFRALSSQFTQTELMKIATEYLGTKAIHSSTIGGFSRGILTEPAPKTFLALGAFNAALARSVGHPEELIEDTSSLGYPPQLPHVYRDLWQHTIPMLDRDNIALGPVGMFEAFCGLRPLPVREHRRLEPEDAYNASRVLGAFLRSYYAKHDIDWYGKLRELAYDCPTIEPLLLNKDVSPDRLLNDLDPIGKLIGLSGDALWEHIQSHLGR